MFKSMNGRGAQDLREMPPHIQEIDHIVCTAPRDIRRMLCGFYTNPGTYQDKAIVMGLDKRTFKRRLDRADYYANSRLDGLPQKEFNPPQNAPSSPKAPANQAHPVKIIRELFTAETI